MTQELDKKSEAKELKALEKIVEKEEVKKLDDELLKEESTDEKDDKVSANPDSNNVHG